MRIIKAQNISPTDLFISFLLLGVSAIFVYGFFSLLLEGISYISFDDYDTSILFYGKERVYINIFLAGLSILFGIHTSLQFLLSRIQLSSYQNNQLLHKSRWLLWIVLFLTIQFYAIVCFHYDLFFATTSFTNTFIWIGGIQFLILLVLFSYIASSINRLLYKGQPKVLYLGLFIFFGLSIGMAKIHWISPDFQETALNQNVVYTHGVNYPKSEINEPIKGRYPMCDFVLAKHPETQEVKLYYQNKEILLEEFDTRLEKIRSNFRDSDSAKIKLGLRVDKQITLKELFPFFERFCVNHIFRLYVYTSGPSQFKEGGIQYRLDPNLFYDYLKDQSRRLDYLRLESMYRVPKLPPFIRGYYPTEGGVHVFQSNNSVTIGKDLFTTSAFIEKLKDPNGWSPAKRIHYYFIDINTTFGDYIYTKSQLYQSFYEVRNEIALDYFNTPYTKLSKEKKKEIRKEYPINILEFGLNGIDDTRIQAFFKEQEGYSPYFNCIPEY